MVQVGESRGLHQSQVPSTRTGMQGGHRGPCLILCTQSLGRRRPKACSRRVTHNRHGTGVLDTERKQKTMQDCLEHRAPALPCKWRSKGGKVAIPFLPSCPVCTVGQPDIDLPKTMQVRKRAYGCPGTLKPKRETCFFLEGGQPCVFITGLELSPSFFSPASSR